MRRSMDTIFIFIFLVATALMGCNGELSLSPPANPIRHSFGDDLSVDCSDPDALTVNIQWFGPNNYFGSDDTGDRTRILARALMPTPDGQRARTYSVQSLPSGVSTLWVDQFQASDAGLYRCTGMAAGRQVTKSFSLEGYKAVEIMGADHQHLIFEEDSGVLFTIIADPPPKLTFTKNSQPVDLSSSKYTLDTVSSNTENYENEYRLTVHGTVHDDAGEYEVSARQTDFQKSEKMRIRVRVYERPTFTQVPTSISGVARLEVSMTCQATGVPPPKYRWYTGTEQSPSGTEIDDRLSEDIHVNVLSGDLYFKNLAVTDEGYYWCQPFNEASELPAEMAKLTVIQAPLFENSGNDTDTPDEPDRIAEIFCQASAKPAPQMQFVRTDTLEVFKPGHSYDNGRINLNLVDSVRPIDQIDKPLLIPQKTLTLTVSNPSSNDTGNYTCIANNTAGRNESTLQLKIQHAPILLSPIRSTVYNWAGNTANLTCSAKAHPLPNWNWKVLGGIIGTDNSGSVKYRKYTLAYDVYSETSLQIQIPRGWQDGVIDAGVLRRVFSTYTCEADNSRGTSTAGAVVMAQASYPNAPTIRLLETTATTVTFSVTMPTVDGGPPVIRFFYTLNPGGQAGEHTGYITLEERDRVVVRNLEANVNYQLSVQAENLVAPGHPATANAQTKAPTVPDPPIITSVNESFYSNSYELSWIESTDGGTRVTSYVYSYAKAKPDGTITGDRSRQFRVIAQTRSVTISSLDPGTWYAVWLQPQNAVGRAREEAFLFQTKAAGGPSKPAPTSKDSRPTLDLGPLGDVPVEYLIIAAVGIFLVLLIVVDLICCCTKQCGVIMCLHKACSISLKGPDMMGAEETNSNDTGMGMDNLVLSTASLPYQTEYDKQPLRDPEGFSSIAGETNYDGHRGAVRKGYSSGSELDEVKPKPILKSSSGASYPPQSDTRSVDSLDSTRAPLHNYSAQHRRPNDQPPLRSEYAPQHSTNGRPGALYRQQQQQQPSPASVRSAAASDTENRFANRGRNGQYPNGRGDAQYSNVGQQYANGRDNGQYPNGRDNGQYPNGRDNGQYRNGRGPGNRQQPQYNIRDRSSNSSNEYNPSTVGSRADHSQPAPPPQAFDNSSVARDYPELAGRPVHQPPSQPRRTEQQPQHHQSAQRGRWQQSRPAYHEAEMTTFRSGPSVGGSSMGGKPSQI